MIAQSRDVRTGAPVWTAYEQPAISVKPLQSNAQTDVLIIGAGISGAMMAEALSGQGVNVMVVDKRVPMGGATSASTALLQYEIDVPLIKLGRKIGQKKAIAAWRRSKLGLESLAGKIRELEIECDYQRRDSLYLSGNLLSPAALKEEQATRAAAGFGGMMLGGKDLSGRYGIDGKAAILSWDNIACNPVQLTAGLLKAAQRRGAAIHAPADIEDVSIAATYIKARADNGYVIKARKVIFATGFEIPSWVNSRKHKINSTWALATKPIKGLPADLPLVWEAAEPYIYARTTSDDRIIFGGEDEPFSDADKRDALIPAKQAVLEKKLARLFPDLACETDYVWAGSFGGSNTGLPSIGPIPGRKGCYAVMAYGGNGITFSRIAAEIITAHILGYKDHDAKLFSFSA